MITTTTEARYDKETVNNAASEFLDLSDDNADSWLSYLLQSWISSDAIDATDADMRGKLMGNINAITSLVRTVQESHRYHYMTKE